MAWIPNALVEVEKMSFYIQACSPTCTHKYNSKDSSLAEAIETIFPLYTENVILYWNHVPIALSYKYDISYMASDLIMLLENVTEHEKGESKIAWLPDTFRSDWNIWWKNGNIHIAARWENLIGDVHLLLKKDKQIDMEIIEFMSEWKLPLQNIINALQKSGYMDGKIQEIKRLTSLVCKIPNYGVLYSDREG